VHPVLPYILSSSDDMLIKLWDWEKVSGTPLYMLSSAQVFTSPV
jgi:hypothetical protein